MEEEMAQNHSKNKHLTTAAAAGILSRRKPTISNRPAENNTNTEQVKLAALAISFNIRLRSADMPLPMQERALRLARALLDAAAPHRRPNPTLLSRSLKKEFDSVYGPAWHCIAGKSFGSFVTHSPGGFLYFSIDSFSFLLFKTEVHVLNQPSPKS